MLKFAFESFLNIQTKLGRIRLVLFSKSLTLEHKEFQNIKIQSRPTGTCDYFPCLLLWLTSDPTIQCNNAPHQPRSSVVHGRRGQESWDRYCPPAGVSYPSSCWPPSFVPWSSYQCSQCSTAWHVCMV